MKWIEAAGARVVPIRFDANQSELDKMFDSVNGILFTGGDAVLDNLSSPYMQAAGHLLNRSITGTLHLRVAYFTRKTGETQKIE